MKIAIGNDHAGYEIKMTLLKWLEQEGHELKNFGTDTLESVDYPDYVHPVAKAIEKGEFKYGVLICGSGQGVSFTANKHQGIRAALCWNAEIAEVARKHNNANILCLPGRYISKEESIDILKKFLYTQFEGGRHQNRLCKVSVCSACSI
uniref:ribose 5-phosphate isomerase B n=1 Tax=uncultured Draconibacterium sp. TaxID=1573823 RepID=UPI00321656B3